MPNSRRQTRRIRVSSRRRGNRSSRNTIACPFLVNLVSNGQKTINLADLSVSSLQNIPIRPISAWFQCTSNVPTSNNFPVVTLNLVNQFVNISCTSRPVQATLTTSPRTHVRAPNSDDFQTTSATGSALAYINVTNISSSEAVVVTITGVIRIQHKSRITPAPVAMSSTLGFIPAPPSENILFSDHLSTASVDREVVNDFESLNIKEIDS